MDWSRIKTIFIIAFLILDIFLAREFLLKKDNSQIDHISEESIEDSLAENGIKYSNMPKDVSVAVDITGKIKEFKGTDINTLKNQQVKIVDKTKIVSELDHPVAISTSNKTQSYKDFLKNYTYLGSHYTYWRDDEVERKIYFIQNYKDKSIFNNPSGMIVLNYDEQEQIISYSQTMLEDLKDMEETEDKQLKIIPAIKALETLFRENEVKPNTTITKIEIGYYKYLNPFPDEQIMRPTWRFTLSDKQEFFVNANEGQIIKMENRKLE